MRAVHIVGAGGIGIALGCRLAKAGWAVTMVEKSAKKRALGQKDGIALDGERPVKVAFADFEEWEAPASLPVLLCTKTFDNATVLARTQSRHNLLPVQNGFDAALEASDHPCEAIASFVSQPDRDRPTARITRPGELYLGGRRALDESESSSLQELAAGLANGGPVRVVDRIAPYKFTKLLYNAAISPLAASAGVDNGQLLSDPLAQRLFFALLRENYAILRRNHVPLARIGPFHPQTVDRILRVPAVARLLARLFEPGLRNTYCSMAPDIDSGRTEVDAYNGYLCRLAKGVGCRINTAILEMMRAMKENGLPPGRERLFELTQALREGGAV